MKDETKHFIAKQIAFAVPLILFGWFVIAPICWMIVYNRSSEDIPMYLVAGFIIFIEGHADGLLQHLAFACIPLVIGYCYKLFKWVMKWK